MMATQKERGAYFTPPSLSEFLTGWAVEDANSRVLDPGAGDGEFLQRAVLRLMELGVEGAQATRQVTGVEIEAHNAKSAQESLSRIARDGSPTILTANVFDVCPEAAKPPAIGFTHSLPLFDAVIGNPPYVRYHLFKGEDRKKALLRAKMLGVELPGLSSLWAPYIVHAISFLKKDGRLAVVLPAELLTVDYGQQVRDHLLKSFERVSVVAFEERVFPDVLEDVVLLRGERASEEGGLEIIRIGSDHDLREGAEPVGRRLVPKSDAMGEKWTRFLLPEDIDATYQQIAVRPEVDRLGNFATVDIGVVTGNNGYFILDQDEAERYEIDEDYLVPVVRSARTLSGLRFALEDLANLRAGDGKCLLLNCQASDDEALDQGLRSYLQEGVDRGVPTSYKSKARTPWYAIPSIYNPDAFLSYMSSTSPKFVVNEADATCTNTIHRVRFNSSESPSHVAFATSWYNTLTLLSCEIVGRSYGGGVLKHETKEAESILTIPPQDGLVSQLTAVSGKVDTLLRGGEYEDAVEVVDEILLEGHLGLSPRAIGRLRDGLLSLRSRRFSRMRKGT
jgi:adenine-specific DNA methylase